MTENERDYIPPNLPLELHDLWRATWFQREVGRLSSAWQKAYTPFEGDAIGIRANELGIHPERLRRWDRILQEYRPKGFTQAAIAELEDVSIDSIKSDFKDMRKRGILPKKSTP